MPEQPQLPSEEQFNGFVGRLREFRSTLPQEDQRMLDALVQAGFKTEEQGDVQGYWWGVAATPYGPVGVGGPGPAPGFYVAPPPPPVYAVSPWGAAYVRYW
jgi:hypothetical protein